MKPFWIETKLRAVNGVFVLESGENIRPLSIKRSHSPTFNIGRAAVTDIDMIMNVLQLLIFQLLLLYFLNVLIEQLQTWKLKNHQLQHIHGHVNFKFKMIQIEAELFRFNIKIIRSEFSKRRLAIFIGILPKYEEKKN